MSSSFDVYAVPWADLKQVVGAGDQPALLDAATETAGWLFDQIDGIDPECGLTCRQALGQILAGAPLDETLGSLYGYALQGLCLHLGEPMVPNVSGIVGASDWIDGIDQALAAGGVPLHLTDLAYDDRPLPLDLPTPDDYPFIGVWTPGMLLAATQALHRLDLRGLDPGTADDLRAIQGWVDAAARRDGVALIGFLT